MAVPVHPAWVDSSLLVAPPAPDADPPSQARLLARCGLPVQASDLQAWSQSVDLDISAQRTQLQVQGHAAEVRWRTGLNQLECSRRDIPLAGTLSHGNAAPAPTPPPELGAGLPPLSAEADHEVALAAGEAQQLRREVQHARLNKWKLIAATGALAGVDLAISYQLNTVVAPGANPTGDVTLMDLLMRLTAATMMLVTLSAAVLIGSLAAQPQRLRWQRALAAVVSLALGSGAVVMAAAMCNPAFGPAIETLLAGAPIASGMALDTADNAPVWLPLRLLSAVPILAIGLLAGLAELRVVHWASVQHQAAQRLAERQATLSIHAVMTASAQAWHQCQAEEARLADPREQQHLRMACITTAMVAYIDALRAAQPPDIEPAQQTQAGRLLHERQAHHHAQLQASLQALRTTGLAAAVIGTAPGLDRQRPSPMPMPTPAPKSAAPAAAVAPAAWPHNGQSLAPGADTAH